MNPEYNIMVEAAKVFISFISGLSKIMLSKLKGQNFVSIVLFSLLVATFCISVVMHQSQSNECKAHLIEAKKEWSESLSESRRKISELERKIDQCNDSRSALATQIAELKTAITLRKK